MRYPCSAKGRGTDFLSACWANVPTGEGSLVHCGHVGTVRGISLSPPPSPSPPPPLSLSLALSFYPPPASEHPRGFSQTLNGSFVVVRLFFCVRAHFFFFFVALETGLRRPISLELSDAKILWALHTIPPRYKDTSLIIPPPPVGPYSSPMPRDLW